MHDDETPQVSEQELALVKEIIRTLTKTVRTFNVYPKDNPIYQKFATQLFEKFDEFFGASEELPLAVTQHSLLYKDNEVFHSEDRTENFALLLFADGIRQISFQKGISQDEITDFIDILRLAPKSDSDSDDDIVTLLWERSIRNMGYTVVEDTVDDSLAVEESLLRENANPEDAEFVDATASQEGGTGSVSAPASFGEGSAEPLTSEELEAVKADLSSLEELPLLTSAARLFFELLGNEEAADSFSGLMSGLSRVLDICMQKREVQAVIEIARGLKKVSILCQDSGQAEAIREVLKKAGQTHHLRTLFAEASPEEIRQYLLLLDPDSVASMIEVLGELQDRRQRRLLCEVLAEAGKGRVNVLAEALSDSRWYLVRNIVMVLGMIKDPSVVRHIQKVMRHSDLRIKREAIRAIEGIISDDSRKMALSALDDADPTVRITALRVLKRFRDQSLFEALKARVSRDDLRKRSFAEKKEIIETLATVGEAAAFELLSELFRKKGIIEKEDSVELRASAAYGLGLLGTPGAIALLEKEKDSKKDLLREACVKALREAHSGTVVR